MTSIRTFVYAGLLAVTTFNLVPSLAAQEASGKFTLTHDVHWQNAIVPAGEYKFSFDRDGVARVLTLNKVSGTRTGFLIAVRDLDEIGAAGPNKITLEAVASGSYVSAMQLPEFGLAMHFKLPNEGKDIAKAGNVTPTGQ
ncbi:MAG TPA: hypothetical protein VMH04_21650 [Candidatus Solibacter sp.]|jgi:hypothetical protein|nr:hypothetical protein [Candidatus Solibacter sp.]